MNIEDSSLFREVEAILTDGPKPVHFTWQATVHANGLDLPLLKVLSVDVVRDYESNYADEILLTAMVTAGQYAKKILPFQDNLEVTLLRLPLNEASDYVDEDAPPRIERYTATLLERGNPVLEANSPNAPTEAILDITNIWEIQFQLVHKALEQMRMVSVGRIYRNVKLEDVAKGLLTEATQTVKVEQDQLPQGVDMVSASNQQVRDHVIIPHGTRLVDIPYYLDRKCGGLYSAGLGYYYQAGFWYLYPCYDTRRFNHAKRTMTVINIPKNKLPGVERTYRHDGNNLVVLCTGETRFVDDSDRVQLNGGNGVRFADANAFMGNFTTTKDNKTVASRGKNNSEFMGEARLNGNNNIQLAPRPITANPFLESSRIARGQGSLFAFVWENAVDAIFPGMMVKIMYLDNAQVREEYGVLLKAHSYTQLQGSGQSAMRYTTQTVISVFINRLKEPV